MQKVRGFTLLEITVVISIIILLSTIFLASYRGGEKQFALKRSAHQIAQDLRRAQEMAMSGQEFKGAFQGGFGIHFTVTPEDENTGTYTLFVDCDNDKIFDGGIPTCDDCTGDECIGPTFSEEIETFSLEEGIKIANLSPAPPLDVVFFPPDPEVTINGADTITSASITLTFDGQSPKIITINTAGLIEIE
jgi:Tfp pilus assembly major pilin PilA